MLNDKCLIVSYPWSIISQVHVVIVTHLNNFTEIQIHEEPEAPIWWVTVVKIPQNIVAVFHL